MFVINIFTEIGDVSFRGICPDIKKGRVSRGDNRFYGELYCLVELKAYCLTGEPYEGNRSKLMYESKKNNVFFVRI